MKTGHTMVKRAVHPGRVLKGRFVGAPASGQLRLTVLLHETALRGARMDGGQRWASAGDRRAVLAASVTPRLERRHRLRCRYGTDQSAAAVRGSAGLSRARKVGLVLVTMARTSSPESGPKSHLAGRPPWDRINAARRG
jgi:hypothetical protein